jgi:oxygen-independent coproporphyrinogen-3 oxidase
MAGIYIHIPFCKKLCFYCDFYHVVANNDTTLFAKALISEAVMRHEYLGNEEVNTIYIGGGTPSILPVHDHYLLMAAIKENFTVADDAEVTVELNPDDVIPSYILGLKEAGFNRISLGIQSWRDEDLKFLNRRHDSSKAAQALEECLKVFDNVTIDLIYGIPGLTPEAWEMNLDKSFSSGIKHLSAYHLTIEHGTVFGKMREKGLLTEVDEETSLLHFNLLLRKAEAAGFIQYEISNFGKPSYFSRHNSNYWKQVNYLGLGPSAHSFNGYSRQWNRSDLNGYIKAVKSGLPDFETEELDSRTRFNEYVMTALRTMWGIDLEYVEKTFDKEGHDYILSMSSKFRNYGLIKQEKNTLVLTNQGKMISDNIISELMMP